MFSYLVDGFVQGVKRIKDHPQLAYTIFLAVVIVGSFIFIGILFRSVAVDSQERLFDVRIGSIQDTFVQFAPDYLDRSDVLQDRVERVAELNDTIEAFQVVSFRGRGSLDEPYVVASLDMDEVGARVDGESDVYKHARLSLHQSFTFSFEGEDGRFFATVRGIPDEEGRAIGAVVSRQSLSEADRAMNSRIRNSTIILVSLLILVVALFLRHSRIIDYAQLYKKLKEVDEMKDDFISMASHELRTPLSHIRGYVDMIKDTVSSSEVIENLDHIDSQAQQLDGLVADMLDVKRLEQGRMSFEYQKIRPDRVIDEVLEETTRSAEEKGLKLEHDIKDSAKVAVDPSRLKQVLINLIGNAVKYTDEGKIVIKQYRQGDDLAIRVHDTGAGMSAEEQEQLFQKFSRVGSKDQKKHIKGTGLGLWITRQIVEQMGGSISVESIEGVGSDFIVKFPIAGEGG